MTTATAETPIPAPKPEPVKAPATTVTLRHPGRSGYLSCGQYLLETPYTFNTQTDAEIIESLQGKGFITV